MKNFFKKRKITKVADAIAPLQEIVNDLQDVANHQKEQVEAKEALIERLNLLKTICQKEADMADHQVGKMMKVFGIEPD